MLEKTNNDIEKSLSNNLYKPKETAKTITLLIGSKDHRQ